MILRILTILCYALLAVLVLGFIFANRETVLITVPLLAEIEAPLSIALGLTFGLGLLIGLSYAGLVALGSARRERRQRRQLQSLEREVAINQKREMNAPHS